MAKKATIDEIMDMFELGGKDDDKNEDFESSNSNKDPQLDSLIDTIGDSIDVNEIPSISDKHKKAVDLKDKSPDLKDKSVEPTNTTEKEEPKVEKVKEEPVKVVESSTDIEVSNDTEDSNDDFDVDDIFGKNDSTEKDNISDDSNIIKDSAEESTIESANESSGLDEIDEDDSAPEKIEVAEESPKVSATPFDMPSNAVSEESLKTETKISGTFKVVDGVKIVNNEVQWLLTAPAPKYEPFYKQKASALEEILPGGQIKFNKIKDELRGACVNLQTDSMDLSELTEKMNTVQQWQNRVIEMSFDVNHQYHLWDRYIEMMRGNLAMVQYEKPVVKQEGVIFQHMRDMEWYYKQLKYIHEQISNVLQNLTSAWQTISRHATVITSQKETRLISATPQDRSVVKGNINIPKVNQGIQKFSGVNKSGSKESPELDDLSDNISELDQL